MPRKIDPAKIKVGHGLAASDSVEVNALIPGAGEPGSAASGGGAGSVAHIQDEHDAHPASAVSVDDVPKIYDASNVEGVLDELAALVPPKPPTIGNALHYFSTTGIPDWGILKLDDASWFVRNSDQFDLSYGWGWGGKVSSPVGKNLRAGEEVYPYFWRPVFVAEHLNKFAPSNDIDSDNTFNVASGLYAGGGVGEAHAGKLSLNNTTTLQIIPSSGPTGGKKVVVSGVVFPADRGTLALVRFDAQLTNGIFFEVVDPDDFKKLRVLAALNLGQGIFDKCDGSPGGIFWLGDHGGDCAPHSYDPFSFPGRATGQLDLYEIHTGKRRKKGVVDADFAADHPFFDFDGDGVQGAPAAGQVRLGTDPNAGIPLITDGIPIFGGTTAARGGGHDQNFFRYRLPYLADYTQPHGLKWTPPAEQHRYYDKPLVAKDEATPLESAGQYIGFERDYWTFQVARYRHQFSLPDDIILDHDSRASGTYVLFHFKKEEYFEDCVRDEVMPTSDQLYSANLAQPLNPSSKDNIINQATSYNEGLDGGVREARSYHVLRANVFEDVLGDKDSEFCHNPVLPIIDGSGQVAHAKVDFDYPNETTVSVSGVKYWISGDLDELTPNISFRHLDVLLNAPDHDAGVYGLFETSWLGFGNPEGVNAAHDPDTHADRMSHRNPALLSLFSFTQGLGREDGTYELDLKHPEQPSIVDSKGERRGRVEYSYQQLLNPDSGSSVYPEPDRQAHMEGHFVVNGDDENPCFSRDAVIRAFFRRPLNHGRDFLDYTSFYNTGNTVQIRDHDLTDISQLLWYGVNHLEGRRPIRYSNYQPFADLQFDANCLMYKVGQDREERFLDESYRLRSSFRSPSGGKVLNLPHEETLRGPGLPHGTSLMITIPSNGFQCIGTPWEDLHWMTSQSNGQSLIPDGHGMGDELQVAGWPDRNPPIEDGLSAPIISSGCLIYPKHDYSNASPVGPDYSGLTGDRCWIRYFNFYDSEGSSKVTLELDGISLSDFRWKVGKATVGSDKMAVLIKVPGRTTWMDVGRRDGDGPSKQDPFADGAGCKIVGPETKDLDPSDEWATMPNRCVVTCNLGPAATLYNNHDNVQQLLMKVVMYENGASLDLEQGGPTGTHANLKGLVGIRVTPKV